MLSFEEFFTKKKIDLVQLESAEPVLFSEFKHEFEQMGEKSFDHTKKFWFNKLRRAYHIKEEPGLLKTTIQKTEIASQAEPLSSPTIEQKPAYAPRFKAGIKHTGVTSEAKESQKSAQELKPDDFETNPDFKAGMPATPEPESIPPAQTEVIKPAYKPRFNIKNVSSPNAAEKSAKSSEPDEEKPEPKAAYKPRFKMQNIKPKDP